MIPCSSCAQAGLSQACLAAWSSVAVAPVVASVSGGRDCRSRLRCSSAVSMAEALRANTAAEAVAGAPQSAAVRQNSCPQSLWLRRVVVCDVCHAPVQAGRHGCQGRVRACQQRATPLQQLGDGGLPQLDGGQVRGRLQEVGLEEPGASMGAAAVEQPVSGLRLCGNMQAPHLKRVCGAGVASA